MGNAGRHAVVLDLAIESLREWGCLRFRAHGVSMLPAIEPGCSVEIRRVAAEEITPGDIVLTKTTAGLRLHRVIEIRSGARGPAFITRGDNNEDNDQPCEARDLLGRLNSVSKPRRWRRLLARLR